MTASLNMFIFRTVAFPYINSRARRFFIGCHLYLLDFKGFGRREGGGVKNFDHAVQLYSM
jgi:hypothetical protein